MLKLSEPQKRMLGTMEQHKLHIEIYTWQDGYQEAHWVALDLSVPHSMHRPNMRTVQALEHRGLLRRGPKGTPSFRVVLTPEGRAIAEGLQDGKVD